MPELAYPLALLLLLPCLIGLWFVYRRSRKRAMLFSGAPYATASTSWRLVFAQVIPALFVIGLMLGVVALARPRTVFSKSKRTVDAVGMMMVMDVSGSMEALDMSTKSPTGNWNYKSRLEAVKETFQQFVTDRPDDLIGLVTFGGYASTRAPLTVDHNIVLTVLEAVEVPHSKDSEETLTAIGDALVTAAARLEKAELKTRIIVLLSDGVSNTGIIKPEEAMLAAKELGLRVYTIGVGSSGRAPFWMRDIFGKKTIGYAEVDLDEKLLKKIASETGARYFNVRDPKGLAKAVEEINKLEKTTVTTDVVYRYNELFLWWLAPSLLIMLFAAIINMTRTGRLI
jgi:Ca-activated chloride channel family protein